MLRPSTATRFVSRLIVTSILVMPVLATAETNQPVSADPVVPHSDEAPSATTSSSKPRPHAKQPKGAEVAYGTASVGRESTRPTTNASAPTELRAAPKLGSPKDPGPQPSTQARARADQTVDKLASSALAAQRRLRFARDLHDTEQVRCLDEMLSRLHMAARQGRQLRDRRVAALRVGDTRLAALEQMRLASLDERATRLASEARSCKLTASTVHRVRSGVRYHEPALPSAAEYPATRP